MAHEETADLLRSARPKFLQNSIFRQDKRTEIEFCKNFGRVLPLGGWPQKQAVVYTSDIKREWFGATEGRDKPSWLSGPTPRDIGHASLERFASKPVNAYSRPISTTADG
ncbi:hypothetical protein [Ensifer sp. B1-9]|uniref:hypothetical protein n=1 Tax=Ensifer sp. B1-9 TaxID=3141455 RepID=UPI003D1B5728